LSNSHPLRALSHAGVFRGQTAASLGLSRKQLAALVTAGLIERALPDTYRMTAVPRSNKERLRAALLWAGDEAAAAGRSAGELYGLEGVCSLNPEIVVPSSQRPRSAEVLVHRAKDVRALMIREYGGLRTTGVEATLVALAHDLMSEAFEIACEDARRRRLTSVAALLSYVDRFGARGQRGLASMRALLDELDPVHSSRSTLEVKTRRLLVANGITDFVREFPLAWNERTYLYDFGFERRSTILETNGRRWHDDARDYEKDNETWSVPGRHGFRIVFATWEKVTRRPAELLAEIAATLAA
jgi:hypothetical protein